MKNLQKEKFSYHVDIGNIQQLPSNQDLRKGSITSKSLNQLDKDLSVLPLLLDKKFKLYRAKNLELVFLRLKANLTLHLRKRVSTFKLVRALQTVILDAKMECFYFMKPDSKSYRASLDMPFTSHIGPLNNEISFSKSPEHSSYEIFKMYANASLSLEDMNDIRFIKDNKDISNLEIKEILRAQQLTDVLTFFWKASIHSLKLQSFYILKGHSDSMNLNTFRDQQICSLNNLSTRSISRKKFFKEISVAIRTEEGIEKLSSLLSNYKKKIYRFMITHLKNLDKDISFNHIQKDDKTEELGPSSFRQKLSSYFMSKRRMRSLDMGPDDKSKLQITSARDASSLPRPFKGESDQHKMKAITVQSLALPSMNSYSKSARLEEAPKDTNKAKNGLIKALEDIFLPTEHNNSWASADKENNKDQGEMPSNVTHIESTFHTSAQYFSNEPRVDQISYASYRSQSSTTRENAKTKDKLEKMLKILSSSGTGFGAKKMERYLRYEHSLLQISRIYASLSKRLLLRVFTDLRNTKWESRYRHRALLGVINKRDYRVDRYKRKYFKKWKETASVSLTVEIGLKILVNFAKNKIKRDLGRCLVILRMKTSKQRMSQRSSAHFRDFFLQIKSPNNDEEGISSRFDRISGGRSTGSTRREILLTSASSLSWRVHDIVNKIIRQNKRIGFESIKDTAKAKFENKSKIHEMKQQNMYQREKEAEIRIFSDIVGSVMKISQLETCSEAFGKLRYCLNLPKVDSKIASLVSLDGFDSVRSYKRKEITFEEDEKGQIQSLSATNRKLCSIRSLCSFLRSHTKNERVLRHLAFMKLKLYYSYLKALELTSQYQSGLKKIEAQKQNEIRVLKKASSLILKLHAFYQSGLLKAKGVAFKKLIRQFGRHGYMEQRGSGIMKIKLTSLVKMLSRRASLNLQLQKVKAFYKLLQAGQDDRILQFSCLNRDKSVSRPILNQFALIHTLETIYRLYSLRSYSVVFSLLKEFKNKKTNQEGYSRKKLALLFKNKATVLFGRTLANYLPIILKLKAWKKLKEETTRLFRPRTELQYERGKLRKKNLLYLLKIMSLVERFHQKNLLSLGLYKLKEYNRDKMIELLNNRILLNVQTQEAMRVFLGGIACIEKIVYHENKKGLETCFSVIRAYAQDNRAKLATKKRAAVKIFGALTKIFKRQMLVAGMKRFKSARKQVKKSASNQIEILGDITNLTETEEATEDIGKRPSKDIKNKSFEKKTVHFSYPIETSDSQRDADFSMEKVTITRPKRINNLPPNFQALSISSDLESKSESIINGSTVETPSPLQPLAETPNQQYWSQPSGLENISTKLDSISTNRFGTEAQEAYSTTYRTYSTLPKSPGKRKASWQSHNTRMSPREGNKENIFVSAEPLESPERENMSSVRTTVKSKDEGYRTAQNLNNDAAISKRLHNLANFSFKPTNKRAHLRLGREDGETSRSGTIDRESEKSSKGTLSTLPLPNTVLEKVLDSNAKRDVNGFGTYYCHEHDDDIEVNYQESFKGKTSGAYRQLHEHLNQGVIYQPSSDRKKRIKSLADPGTISFPEPKGLFSPKHGQSYNFGSGACLNQSNQSTILREDMMSQYPYLVPGSSKKMHKKADYYSRESLYKNNTEVVHLETSDKRNLMSQALHRRDKGGSLGEFQYIMFGNQYAKKDQQKDKILCLNKTYDHCDLCGRDIESENEYIIKLQPFYPQEIQKLNVSLIGNEDGDLKTRLLQRIVEKKMEYLEHEKKKGLGKLGKNKLFGL